MERKSFIGTAEATNEVVFEGVDGTFGGIAVVDVRGDKLKINLLLMHELLENVGLFIVEALEVGAETRLDKKSM